ncbi:MAG: hypothetical protein FWF44_10155 [Defluviitaleaceae bacterium]|nr:hypothetical protein [Defluviitaleaceae bacterium]
MKALIFPTNTGQGHNICARAVKEYLDTRGAEAKVLDFMNVGKNQKSGFFSNMYDGAVNRVPKFFGALYSIAEHISSPRLNSPIYLLNIVNGRSLLQKINDEKPDVIVCPHMFSMHTVTRLIQKHGLKIPTVGILTDYTCSPFWEENRLDWNIVANQAVADDCVSRGMDRNWIVPSGIPVSARFNRKIPKAEARAAFGVTKETVFAVMGGSMGYGKIPELSAELARRRPDAQVIAVCGTNKAVYEKTKGIENVIALPFIDNVDVLIDAADVYLTKPGGLSTTEAMTKRVPMVITLPIPGGEADNSKHIAGLGMAMSANTIKDSVDAACALFANPAMRQKMIAAQEKHCSVNAARDAGELIIKAGSRQ